MNRLFKRGHKKVSSAPGTLEYTGESRTERVRIRLIDYRDEHLEEREIEELDALAPYRDSENVTWMNVDGLHDTAILERLRDRLGVHPLVLEDIANTQQRPKLEDHGEYLFVVTRVFSVDDSGHLSSEQISFLLGKSSVLSFQEVGGDVFEGVRERIRNGKGRLRHHGADYLLYALVDAIVDSYFVVLEQFAERLETLEEEIAANAQPEQLRKIHEYRRELILLRKHIFPMREMVSGLKRTESELVKEDTHVFIDDVYDHVIRVMETVDSYRELLSSLQDLYLSSISNRMNEVMKVLTIIATIFVPLTFVAGIYGMNFEVMPELGWPWAYAVFWVVIAGITGAMLAFFRRKGWF